MPRAASSTPVITLTPQTIDLELYAGDGVSLRLIVNYPTGEPIDLSGEITAQVRDERGAAEALADFAIDPALVDDGIVVITLTGDQTSSFHDNDIPPITVIGTIDAVADLPATNNAISDQYIIAEDNHYYKWSGTVWEDQGLVPPPTPFLTFRGVWDCQWLPEGSTLPLTLVQGNVTSSLDVTRPSS